MPIINQERWEQWIDSEKDDDGKICVNMARDVMDQLDIIAASDVIDTYHIMVNAAKNLQYTGITGGMAGSICEMVSECHSRGKEFNTGWNKITKRSE
jgi:3,4-dihydroxy-2-butanone 4-phosphate synthase